MSFFGIVVAAGQGERFGGRKHDLNLGDKPLWQWARDALLDGGAAGVIVVGSVPGGIAGGDRRRDSVAIGLAQVSGSAAHVLVHDAARPLASPDLVRAVVARVEKGDVAGVVPVLPVRDTLKRAHDGLVAATIDRGDLYVVQTPQGFDVAALRDAHERIDGDASDDALLIERAGGLVATVPGEHANVKVTFPEDLALLKALLP